MGTSERARFIDLGRSTAPPSSRSPIGSYPHPFVVQLSVSGPRPLVAVSLGSGHLGSGKAMPLDEVLLATGELDPRWAEEFEGSGARWAIPMLQALAAGTAVTESELVDAYRSQYGADPLTEMLPIP
jgi:hypothetical protein